MIAREAIAQTLPNDFVHVVTGAWDTKTIYIDGALVTPEILRARVLEEEEEMSDEHNDYRGAWGIDFYDGIQTFDWGGRSQGAQMLSLAWIFWFGGIDLHDWVFRREIAALPLADFVYQYPRSRLARDAKQGGIEFAADFKRGMDELGATLIDS